MSTLPPTLIVSSVRGSSASSASITSLNRRRRRAKFDPPCAYLLPLPGVPERGRNHPLTSTCVSPKFLLLVVAPLAMVILREPEAGTVGAQPVGCTTAMRYVPALRVLKRYLPVESVRTLISFPSRIPSPSRSTKTRQPLSPPSPLSFSPLPLKSWKT